MTEQTRQPLLNNLWFFVILSVIISAVDGYASERHETWGDWPAAAYFGSFAAVLMALRAVGMWKCHHFADKAAVSKWLQKRRDAIGPERYARYEKLSAPAR